MLNVLNLLDILRVTWGGASGGPHVSSFADTILDPSVASSMNTLFDESGTVPTDPDDLGDVIGFIGGHS